MVHIVFDASFDDEDMIRKIFYDLEKAHQYVDDENSKLISERYWIQSYPVD